MEYKNWGRRSRGYEWTDKGRSSSRMVRYRPGISRVEAPQCSLGKTCFGRPNVRQGTAGLWGLRWPGGAVGRGVANAVVIELENLNRRVAAATRCDAVDEGDGAFPPLADLDVL